MDESWAAEIQLHGSSELPHVDRLRPQLGPECLWTEDRVAADALIEFVSSAERWSSRQVPFDGEVLEWAAGDIVVPDYYQAGRRT